ncbi:hypothetical protein CesoFtcFv8_024733 [Champsocephalus esox]|uniref:Uncharacterized protein n=2 Tax=Champsocephalus esox TaxID=159716 RepID=A0AAN8B7N1_9TELE|nr:hypothetical protein CesoFtcFv8_024733 [Champsocephalus esox]
MLPVSMVETATVEQGPGGGPGIDSMGQGLAGTKDSPVAGEVGVKPGARKGSQAFGTEVSADNGDCTQVGNSKRPKTEGMRVRAKEVVGKVDGQKPHGKGQSSAGPTLRERQVGRSNRVEVSAEHLDKIQRDTTC